eukprot:5016399-Pleurochrysis_carterae.AAC.3
MSTRVGSMIGWDCVIEWPNAAISEGVSHHVSEERIARFISVYPVLEQTFKSFKAHLLKSKDAQRVFMNDMVTDAAHLKDLFATRIEHDWGPAPRWNLNSTVGLTRGARCYGKKRRRCCTEWFRRIHAGLCCKDCSGTHKHVLQLCSLSMRASPSTLIMKHSKNSLHEFN